MAGSAERLCEVCEQSGLHLNTLGCIEALQDQIDKLRRRVAELEACERERQRNGRAVDTAHRG